MAKTFRVTYFVRLGNLVVATMLRLGANMEPIALLTVRGRKSGRMHTIPVAVVEQEDRRYLISPYGEVNWVRNLRAAGEAVLTRARRSETISAIELSAKEAAPVLRHSFQTNTRAPSFIRDYYDVTADSSIEEFEREALRHPVFHILDKKSEKLEPVGGQLVARTAN